MADAAEIAEARRIARNLKEVKDAGLAKMTQADPEWPRYNRMISDAQVSQKRLNQKYGKDVYSKVESSPVVDYYEQVEPTDPKNYGR